MYVGVLHTAVHETQVEMRFVCAACGHAEPVRITVKGAGQGVAHYGIDEGAARNAARRRAAASAQTSAQIIFEALRCPRCRAPSRGGSTRFVWITLPLTLFAMCLTLALGGGLALAVLGDRLGAVGPILAVASMLAIPLLLPTTLFVLLRSRPAMKLRSNTEKHAVFTSGPAS
jgi:hypothetical protein